MNLKQIITNLVHNVDVEKTLEYTWNNDETFWIGMNYYLNPEFKILTKIPAFDENNSDNVDDFSFNDFNELFISLFENGSNEEDKYNDILDASEKCDIFMWNNWYRRILNKTLEKSLPMNKIANFIKNKMVDI